MCDAWRTACNSIDLTLPPGMDANAPFSVTLPLCRPLKSQSQPPLERPTASTNMLSTVVAFAPLDDGA